ncbi:hypothetical protein Tco_1413217, partial [Tanacetum coccineum]
MRTRWFNIEGVEELKRNVRIKGVKKEALHTTLGRNWINGPSEDKSSWTQVIIKQLNDVPIMRTSKYGESNASTLYDPTLQAGNPVKEILLKLNLPDHRMRFPKGGDTMTTKILA